MTLPEKLISDKIHHISISNKNTACDTSEKENIQTPILVSPPRSVPYYLSHLPPYSSKISYPAEYFPEIYMNLMNDCQRQNYSYEAFKKIQTNINVYTRNILFDWIVDIHLTYALSLRGLFLSLNLLNRYSSKEKIEIKKIQAIGTSAMVISWKNEEREFPGVSKFEMITDEGAKKEDIFKYEDKILGALDFDILIPNEFDIFELLRIKFDLSEEEFFYGVYLLISFNFNENILKFKPNTICDAVCILIGVLFNKKDIIDFYQVDSDYSFKEAKEVSKEIYFFLIKIFPFLKLDCYKRLQFLLHIKDFDLSKYSPTPLIKKKEETEEEEEN